MSDPFFAAEIGADVPEVDLHSMNQGEAGDVLEKAIQHAFMQSDHVIRIIHGHGEGVLRDLVEKKLSSHPNVKSFKMGAGVSYAELERR